MADIGGTNARFGWVAAAGGDVRHVQTFPVVAHPGPNEAAQAYLRGLAAAGAVAAGDAPAAAAFAVATAVRGDRVEWTNSPWSFSRAALVGALGLERLVVLNDFEALALSLPRLQAQHLRPGSAAERPAGPRAVIGPGTGLGVAGLVPTAAGWVALPGEGGHATLAPADDFESALLADVRRSFAHVSAERLLSGIGLPLLHTALARLQGGPAEALTAPEIVERGRGVDADGGPVCRHCAQTLDVFCALLGGFAGNVALTLGARGGVYIGGGIVPRLAERFFASRFRERFEAKGRFAGYLQAIPTALITHPHAALVGAAAALDGATAG